MNKIVHRATLVTALAAALASGCKPESPGIGSSGVSVSFRGLDADAIVGVTISVQGPGIGTPIFEALAENNGAYTGVIDHIPAGADRSFAAVAFDIAGSPVLSGQMDGVTIAADAVAQVMIVMHAGGDGFANGVPVIDGMNASANAVAPGQSISLELFAHDTDSDDSLSFAWTAPDGSFSSADAASTEWTAPLTAGDVEITATVTDASSQQASLTLLVSVDPQHATGKASIEIEINHGPSIQLILAMPGRVDSLETTQLSMVIEDPDSTTQAILWSDAGGDCAGQFDDVSAESPTWTAPAAQPAAGLCTLAVLVTDAQGATTAGEITIQVAPPSPVALSPVITRTFASAEDAAGDDLVVLRARAADPAGGPLQFDWTASAGSLGAPANTAYYDVSSSHLPGGPAFDLLDTPNPSGLAQCLDCFVQLALPFTFEHFGAEHTTIFVGSNGYITFGAGAVDWYNQSLADETEPRIAAWYDDWDLRESGEVRYGVHGVAPSRVFVVAWIDVKSFPGDLSPDGATFQIHLHEGSHTVEMHYADVTVSNPDLSLGRSATIGLDEGVGRFHEYSFDRASLSDGMALRFEVMDGSMSEVIWTAPFGAAESTISVVVSSASGLQARHDFAVSGDAALPPTAQLSTDSISDSLPAGATASHEVTLTNAGDLPLDYDARLSGAPGSPSGGATSATGVASMQASAQILVKRAAGATATRMASLRSSIGARLAKRIDALDIEVWTDDGSSTTSFNARMAALTANPQIAWAEPNVQWSVGHVAQDPMFDMQWSLHNDGQTGGTTDADIDASEAWDRFMGSSNVIVAVTDTGVDYTHSDLAANMWTNSGEIPGNGLDDDGNGFVDDVYGYDFAYADSDPMDVYGHGTHVSGTIGALADNGIGVAGVSPNVRIMPVKFLADDGWGTSAGGAAAIVYAVDNGARIINASWGGTGYSQAIYDAIEYAAAHDVLFVAAAGNSGSNNDASPRYPAAYDLPNIVAVAATDHDDALTNFSCYGPTTVDLGAPGANIASTIPGDAYASWSGTSMAAPHVAGTAALLAGFSPGISYADMKAYLLDSSDPTPSLAGLVVSGGRLNADRALAALSPAWLLLAGPVQGQLPAGASVTLTVDMLANVDPGTHAASMTISTNDPITPVSSVALSLTVTP